MSLNDTLVNDEATDWWLNEMKILKRKSRRDIYDKDGNAIPDGN